MKIIIVRKKKQTAATLENHITLQDTYNAYLDCRKHKTHSNSCLEFEYDEASNLYGLYQQLLNDRYEIGYSNSFIVTQPKLREVFAADFKDRIVHHLVIGKTLNIFEDAMIHDTYNCRKGKGTLYGVKAIHEKMHKWEGSDKWVLKCDIKGFFMHIDKEILWYKIESLLDEKYHEDDKEWLKGLMKQIIMHCPEKKCIKKGDVTLFDKINPEKTLFNTDGTRGLAIGNLTSQIFANFYLNDFDHWIIGKGFDYGRYVDDFVVIGDHGALLKLIPEIRGFLADNLKISLHPDKIYLQPINHGVRFTGMTIYPNRIYINNSVVYRAFKIAKAISKGKLGEEMTPRKAKKLCIRFNSYLSLMKHAMSYNIRKRLWECLDYKFRRFIYTNDTYTRYRVKKIKKWKRVVKPDGTIKWVPCLKQRHPKERKD